MIAIIDYGLGNVLAFLNVYRRLNIPVVVAKNSSDLVGVQKLILPGVGSFDHAMHRLNQSGMRLDVERLVLQERVPILGVCVGMQMLAGSSEEGSSPGLGWLEGIVRKFSPSELPRVTPLPHMGWNDVNPKKSGGLFFSLENDARFYFLHSFYFQCNHPDDVLAETDYGSRFSSAVVHDNIFGVQFHPEKSHHFGSQLLKNFAEM